MENELENITANQTPMEIALGIDKNGMTTARKLYEFLGLNSSNYSKWYKTNITENEFAIENEDYFYSSSSTSEQGRGNFAQDFKLTASFAKKLSMLQKNERGEQARNYFIKVEGKLKEVVKEEQKYIREVSFKEQVESIAAIADMLHVNDAGKITMLDKLYKSYQLPTDFLPQYELNGNHELKSLTALIKRYGYKTTATKLNKLFLQAGILEEHSRDTSNRKKHPNGKKPFKVLTEKGKKYGENAISPKNTQETQPLYYVDTFEELYHLVMQEVL